ncbi:hypothetical protein K450DRAFT_242941 [Umbelopsis ramanniana AG]|uniref:Uncharacterized protein n=1 Tax=Umbelopsis ramanniana AG TaxID=1314678 RepID=A0AAD5E9W0_UMBRA|nr:uncharacterized protein K450DRAFT_242941 [Umbelopsis ramanniana AG]KAI8579372.1 hypothetical protein K450DRAFT_242941 [Umbelopsis ramanniana AG]
MAHVSLVWTLPPIFHLASLAAGLCVIMVFCLMNAYRPSLADRISLRLVFAANISGVILSVWQTVVVFLSSSHRTACLAAEFFLTMSDTAASLFLMFVGFNLMLLVVFRIPASRPIEYSYYIFSCLVGLINGLVIVLRTTRSLPESDTPNCCIFVIVISSIVFTSTIIVLYSKKGWVHQGCDLRRPNNSWKPNQRPTQGSPSGSSNDQVILFKKVVFRCLLYPAVLIFINLWGFIYFMVAVVQKNLNFVLLLLDQCIIGSAGLFVAIIFFSDPAVKKSTSDCLEWIHAHYVDEYTENSIPTAGQRRKSMRIINVRTRLSTQTSADSIAVDRLVPYPHPRLAKYLNWILTKVFRWKERPRICRSVSHLSHMKGTSLEKVRTGSTFYLPSVDGSLEDIHQMDMNGISTTDMSIPDIVVTGDKGLTVPPVSEAASVTTSDKSSGLSHENLREQLDKYSISESDEATDDEVPHFPDHVLNGIRPSPAAAHHAARPPDPYDDSEEDCHTIDSKGLDLEAVGMDDRPHY